MFVSYIARWSCEETKNAFAARSSLSQGKKKLKRHKHTKGQTPNFFFSFSLCHDFYLAPLTAELPICAGPEEEDTKWCCKNSQADIFADSSSFHACSRLAKNCFALLQPPLWSASTQPSSDDKFASSLAKMNDVIRKQKKKKKKVISLWKNCGRFVSVFARVSYFHLLFPFFFLQLFVCLSVPSYKINIQTCWVGNSRKKGDIPKKKTKNKRCGATTRQRYFRSQQTQKKKKAKLRERKRKSEKVKYSQ